MRAFLIPPRSVFPAKAGTQTLTLRREGTHWTSDFAEYLVDGEWMKYPPLPTLSPSRGERAFSYPAVSSNPSNPPSARQASISLTKAMGPLP